MDMNANSPTVIDIVDDPLPNGRRHSMSLKVWTLADTSGEEQKRAARVIAIGFLERALTEMRRSELN